MQGAQKFKARKIKARKCKGRENLRKEGRMSDGNSSWTISTFDLSGLCLKQGCIPATFGIISAPDLKIFDVLWEAGTIKEGDYIRKSRTHD